MITTPSRYRPSDVLAALTTSAVTLAGAGLAAASIKTIFPQYARYAFFGPIDGLGLWLLLGLVAWMMAFLGIERRRDRLAGADARGRPGRRLEALAASWGHLVAFLGIHALVYGVALAAMVAWVPDADPTLIGISLGFFGVLPLSLLAPWAAARALVVGRRAEMDPVSATLSGWISLVFSPLRILAGLVPNLLVLAAVGIPVHMVVDQGYGFDLGFQLGTWLVLSVGATHLQLALGGLAEDEGLFGAAR